MTLMLDRTWRSARRHHPEFDLTCRLHGIDPYTYLVDVLQRISERSASRVAELTLRLCKQFFAAAPLRSDIREFPV